MARRRPVDDDEDDTPRRRRSARDDDEDDGPGDPDRPRNDAYTGLLAINLVALLAAAGLYYLDASELTAQSVQPPAVTVPGLTGAAAAPGG